MIEIHFASELFGAAAVITAAHRHSASCFVDIEAVFGGVRIRLTPKGECANADALAAQLRNDVLDEQLRILVRSQTRELHVALVQAALDGARRTSNTSTP